MDKSTCIFGIVLELVSLVLIVRLWRQRPSRVATNIFWSMILLIPFLGLIFYFFLHENPKEHGERTFGSDSGGEGSGPSDSSSSFGGHGH